MMDLEFTEGEQAFDDDQGYADNPYQKSSPQWHRWLEGYRLAEMNASEPPPRKEEHGR